MLLVVIGDATQQPRTHTGRSLVLSLTNSILRRWFTLPATIIKVDRAPQMEIPVFKTLLSASMFVEGESPNRCRVFVIGGAGLCPSVSSTWGWFLTNQTEASPPVQAHPRSPVTANRSVHGGLSVSQSLKRFMKVPTIYQSSQFISAWEQVSSAHLMAN